MKAALAVLLLCAEPAQAANAARAPSRAGPAASVTATAAPVTLSVAPLTLMPAPLWTGPAAGPLAPAPVFAAAPQAGAFRPAPVLAAPRAAAFAAPLAAAPRAAQEAPRRLIDALAAPLPGAEGGASALSPAEAERDFMARAQLAGGGAPVPAAAAAPPAGLASGGRLASADPAPAPGRSRPGPGAAEGGGALGTALRRLLSLPAGSRLALDFAPGPESLEALAAVPVPVVLSRAGGAWVLTRGGLGEAPAAEFTAVNRARLERADVAASAGRPGRFFAATASGLVEWSPDPDWRGASQHHAWARAADALASQSPLISPLARALAYARSFAPEGRALVREMGENALAAQAADARGRGADAVMAAFEDGVLARTHPQLAARLEAAGEDAMREALRGMDFEPDFLYGGVTGTHLYVSASMPGAVLKVYKRPLDLLGLPSSASAGYALAKSRLGGLFAQTAIIRDATVRVGGRPRRYSRVLVQQRAKTKGVKDWAARARATLDAMERRGVRDADTGPRRGVYDAETARNLGEAPDGSLVHFDADWFQAAKGAAEPGRRVPDPEPLRSAARAAQRRALAALWAESAP